MSRQPMPDTRVQADQLRDQLTQARADAAAAARADADLTATRSQLEQTCTDLTPARSEISGAVARTVAAEARLQVQRRGE